LTLDEKNYKKDKPMKEDLPPKSTIIKGQKVYYDDETKDGVYCLGQDLDFSEAEVFFKHARMYQKADFEDDKEGQFTIFYNRGRGVYWIERR